MNRKDIEYVLDYLGCKDTIVRGDTITFSCLLAKYEPAHFGSDRRPSCNVKITDGISPTYCFACGKHGGLLKYMWKYCGYAGYSQAQIQYLNDFILCAEDTLLQDLLGKPIKREPAVEERLLDALGNFEYCYEFKKNDELRLLGNESWWEFWQVGGKDGRVLFPLIEKRSGDIKFVQGRLMKDNMEGPKYKTYPKGASISKYLFGEHMHTPQKTTGIIMEGIVDTINTNYLLEKEKFHDTLAVGLMGKNASDAQVTKIKSYFQKVILMLDNDPPGRTGAYTLEHKLKNSMITYGVTYPEGFKDPDDLCHSDRLFEVLSTKETHFERTLKALVSRAVAKS